jgi:hypothetical protein
MCNRGLESGRLFRSNKVELGRVRHEHRLTFPWLETGVLGDGDCGHGINFNSNKKAPNNAGAFSGS